MELIFQFAIAVLFFITFIRLASKPIQGSKHSGRILSEEEFRPDNPKHLRHHDRSNITFDHVQFQKLMHIINEKDRIIDVLQNQEESNKNMPIDTSKLDYPTLETRSNELYGKDPLTPIWLGVLDELITRMMPEWFSSKSVNYIRSSTTLIEGIKEARRVFGRDCRRDDIFLFMCVITKNDAVDLQEWLLWQILVVGSQHIIVYMNDPTADHTMAVLQPFVDAGYVTALNMTGTNRQKDAYPACLDIIRKKACNYKGPEFGVPLLESPNCKPGEDIDSFEGKDRPVWIAGFDSDEMAIDINGNCVIDALKNFSSDNGLMLPWICFGHSGHFLSPKDSLVTEAYTHSMGPPDIGSMGKAFNRVYFIKSMTHSHAAIFKNNQLAVDEFRTQSNWLGMYKAIPVLPGETTSKLPFPPRLRLGHYMTKSVSHLVKKYMRGVADNTDRWGRALRRDLSTTVGWLKGFAETWTYSDESFTAYSPMIRFVLDYKNESRPSLSLFTPLGEYGTSALETGADLREEKLLDQLFPRLRVHNHTTLHGPHHNHTAAAKAHNHKKHAAHAPGVDTERAGLDP